MRAHAPRETILLPAELHMAAGTCYAVFAYDVGLSIVLEECERRITALTQRATIRHKHRAPDYFEYRPAPVRVSQEVAPLLVGGYRTHTSVDAVLYDFGAVSITYRIPLQGAFSTLLALGDDLYDNPLLLQDSRQRIAQLLEVIASAVVRPHTSVFVEDYAIFQVEAFTVPCQAEELCAQYAQEIAQLLRLEHQMLSEQEVSDALSHRISFSPDDVTIIDWNAAFLLARDAEDVLAVLEFANVELLEMRYLDEQLDDDLDQSYEALSRHRWGRFRLPGSPRHPWRGRHHGSSRQPPGIQGASRDGDAAAELASLGAGVPVHDGDRRGIVRHERCGSRFHARPRVCGRQRRHTRHGLDHDAAQAGASPR